jgi:CDP-glucose 4,6-dehydratase
MATCARASGCLSVAALGRGRIEVRPEVNTPREDQLLTLDNSKARMRLGWRPRLDFAATIALTADWYSAWARGEAMATLTSAQIATYMEGGT